MKAKPLYFYLTWGFWISLVYMLLIATYNPIVIFNYDFKKNFVFTFPQGWGFFTRNPREVMVDVYKEEGSKLELVSILNSSWKNYLGFSRNSRVVGFEMSEILKSIPHSAWRNGRGSLVVPEMAPDTMKLSKRLMFFPSGIYVFYQNKIVPFAWSNLNQEKYNPFLVARIFISDQLRVSSQPFSEILSNTNLSNSND